jgi:hypothetical protein
MRQNTEERVLMAATYNMDGDVLFDPPHPIVNNLWKVPPEQSNQTRKRERYRNRKIRNKWNGKRKEDVEIMLTG